MSSTVLYDPTRAPAGAGERQCRITTGLDAWDQAFTPSENPGTPTGAFGSGELHVIAGGPGHGVVSALRGLCVAAATDLETRWAVHNRTVLMLLTDDAPEEFHARLELTPSARNEHLADRILLAEVSTSRQRMAKAVYETVARAVTESARTGVPVERCGLPQLVVVHHLSAFDDDHAGADQQELAAAVAFLRRGLARWNLDEMERLSSVTFAEHTGLAWPAGLDDFRPSVLAVTRAATGTPAYTAGAPLKEYTHQDAHGDPQWRVLHGDAALPSLADVTGGRRLIDAADSVVVLHRSQPQTPKVLDPDSGAVRLADTRARAVILKSRIPTDSLVIELRFDSDETGTRGEYYPRHD